MKRRASCKDSEVLFLDFYKAEIKRQFPMINLLLVARCEAFKGLKQNYNMRTVRKAPTI